MSETTFVKVSSSGWLCIRANPDARIDWIPVFQLTEGQMREWLDLTRPKADHVRDSNQHSQER